MMTSAVSTAFSGQKFAAVQIANALTEADYSSTVRIATGMSRANVAPGPPTLPDAGAFIGIESTVRQGLGLNHLPVVVTDACGSKTEELKYRSLAT
jgi:hypothetical protein